ncbi:MAG: hypothetical protein ABR613_09545 [Actinomycetota bacterium]
MTAREALYPATAPPEPSPRSAGGVSIATLVRMQANEVLFTERQERSRWTLPLNLAAGAGSLFVITAVSDVPASKLAPALLPWLVLVAVGSYVFDRLTTVVTPRFLNVHKGPFRYKTWRIEDVASCKPSTYDPARFGGHGWNDPERPRGLLSRRRRVKQASYTMRGERGVLMTPAVGDAVLIGSQRPEELCAAIERARAARGGAPAPRRGRRSGA